MLKKTIFSSLLFAKLFVFSSYGADFLGVFQPRFSRMSSQVLAQEIRQADADAELEKARNFLAIGEQERFVHAQQALQLYRELNDDEGQQEALEVLGWIYVFQQKLDLAIQSTQAAIQINPNSLSAFDSYHLQGLIHLLQNQPKQALSVFRAQMNNAQVRQNKYATISVQENLELAYTALKDYKNSLRALEAIITFRAERSEPIEANILSRLGYVQFQMGDTISAEKSLLQALKKGESAGSEFDVIISQAMQESIAQARKSSGPHGKEHSQPIDILKTLNADLAQLDLLKILKSNEPHLANTCSTLQKLYTDRDDLRGLEISERCRAGALARRLAATVQSKRLTQLSSLDLTQIRNIAKDHQSTLVQYSILSEEGLASGQLTAQEVKLLIWVIQPDGTITSQQVDLQPLWTESIQSLEDIVNQTRQTLGVQGRASVIPTRIKGNRPPANQDTLKDLYQLLIDPIADDLPQDPNAHVVFIPQGALLSVPFSALIDRSGQFLIEKHTLSSVPSIQTLDLTKKRLQQVKQTKNTTLLVVGNPTMPSYSPSPESPATILPSLPGAEIEAKAIAALYKTQALIGKQASENEITPLLSRANIIHFATHGLLDSPPKSPIGAWTQLLPTDSFSTAYDGRLVAPGAIALAPGNGKDGLLTSDEIVKLDLNAELVVLSACDTGQGAVVTDGIIGLSRSILAAGSPSVLASLWKVSDEATAELMVEFYQQLQSNPDKARALRQAILKARQKYPNPIDWAAFSLIGQAD